VLPRRVADSSAEPYRKSTLTLELPFRCAAFAIFRGGQIGIQVVDFHDGLTSYGCCLPLRVAEKRVLPSTSELMMQLRARRAHSPWRNDRDESLATPREPRTVWLAGRALFRIRTLMSRTRTDFLRATGKRTQGRQELLH